MGKCTSCILYIKQNPTTYKETTISQRNSILIAAFLLESSTTNQSIPNKIIYSPLPIFPQKKKNKMVINRVLDLIWCVLLVLFPWKFCQNNSIFVATWYFHPMTLSVRNIFNPRLKCKSENRFSPLKPKPTENYISEYRLINTCFPECKNILVETW